MKAGGGLRAAEGLEQIVMGVNGEKKRMSRKKKALKSGNGIKW